MTSLPAPAPTRSAALSVQRRLEGLLLDGELPAGEKLDEAALAGQLGVSRRPVREAICALAEAGLVSLHKHRGAFVRRLTLREADEIYEVRAVFDRMAGQRLARNIRREQLMELRAIVERMRGCASSGDLERYHAANLRFHDALVEHAGNAKLLQAYRRLVKELSLWRRHTLAAPRRIEASTQEHHRILEMIAAGDAHAAGEALHQHAMSSRARLHALAAAGRAERPLAGTSHREDAAAEPRPIRAGRVTQRRHAAQAE